MHDAKLKYVVFDERSFKNGPILLDDGACSHCLIPDEEEFLPTLRSLPAGDYTLHISSAESEKGVLLVFSLYTVDYHRVAARSLCVSGQACRMPAYCSAAEREDLRNDIYAASCQKVLSDWFDDCNPEFYDTIGIFSRTVIEEAYGDLLTSYDGKAETFEARFALHTTH